MRCSDERHYVQVLVSKLEIVGEKFKNLHGGSVVQYSFEHRLDHLLLHGHLGDHQNQNHQRHLASEQSTKPQQCNGRTLHCWKTSEINVSEFEAMESAYLTRENKRFFCYPAAWEDSAEAAESV